MEAIVRSTGRRVYVIYDPENNKFIDELYGHIFLASELDFDQNDIEIMKKIDAADSILMSFEDELKINENTQDLTKLLDLYTDRQFYCTLTGDYVKIVDISNNQLQVKDNNRDITLTKYGALYPGGECVLYPSKIERDWIKWKEDNHTKIKIYSDFAKSVNNEYINITSYMGSLNNVLGTDMTMLSKLHRKTLLYNMITLVNYIGYGGDNITIDDDVATIYWDKNNKIPRTQKIMFDCYPYTNFHFVFKSEQLLKEFLSYDENVEMIKEYYEC